jgi:hypothetical protein
VRPMKDKLTWTTKDGRVLDVDDMSDTHVRNAFKMLLRSILAAKARKVDNFQLKGDMAQEFNNSYPATEDDAYDMLLETDHYFP